MKKSLMDKSQIGGSFWRGKVNRKAWCALRFYILNKKHLELLHRETEDSNRESIITGGSQNCIASISQQLPYIVELQEINHQAIE